MHRLIIFIIGVLFFSDCYNDDTDPTVEDLKLVDDLGKQIQLDTVPERVITLAPNLTELVFELGKGKSIIGNTQYCNYPDSAKNVEKVGDLLTINFEKVLKLNPDIIFLTVEGNTEESYNKLIELGLKVFVSNPKNFDGIKKSLSDMGKIFKKENTSEIIIGKWNERISKVKSSISNEPPKTAMFLIALQPIMLAGSDTYLNEFLMVCRLKNIADDSDLSYPVFSREQVINRDPDYIIYSEGMNHDEEAFKNAYPEWSGLKAIKNNNIIFIDADLYFRPGPRFILALEDLTGKIYGLN
jgi:iron complex transport system substrate-binding protein